MLTLTLQKLKKVRMTIPSIVLLVLASYRTLSSGDSIQLVGVCAAIVPFFCIFKNFPEADREVPPIQDVISSYILTLILMVVYLGWILTNAMLFFMMMAAGFVKTAALTNIPVIACGFCGLVMVLTFSMIFAGYAPRKKK